VQPQRFPYEESVRKDESRRVKVTRHKNRTFEFCNERVENVEFIFCDFHVCNAEFTNCRFFECNFEGRAKFEKGCRFKFIAEDDDG